MESVCIAASFLALAAGLTLAVMGAPAFMLAYLLALTGVFLLGAALFAYEARGR